MTIELHPIVIRAAPEELKEWQFYEVVYKSKTGEALWYGTVWLLKEADSQRFPELKGDYLNANNPDS